MKVLRRGLYLALSLCLFVSLALSVSAAGYSEDMRWVFYENYISTANRSIGGLNNTQISSSKKIVSMACTFPHVGEITDYLSVDIYIKGSAVTTIKSGMFNESKFDKIGNVERYWESDTYEDGQYYILDIDGHPTDSPYMVNELTPQVKTFTYENNSVMIHLVFNRNDLITAGNVGHYGIMLYLSDSFVSSSNAQYFIAGQITGTEEATAEPPAGVNEMREVVDAVASVEDTIKEEHEKDRGFFQRIIDGILGIPNAISGAFKSLFESLGAVAQKAGEAAIDAVSGIADRLGFMAQIPQYLIDMLTASLHNERTETLTFPSMVLPVDGQEYVLNEETQFSLVPDWIPEEVLFIVRLSVDFIFCMAIVAYGQKLYNFVMTANKEE